MKVNTEKLFDKDHGDGWFKTPKSVKEKMGKETSQFHKFWLLMWKNWLLQIRKKKQTLLEIFFSVIFCILLVIIRHLAPSQTVTNPTVYTPFDISKLPDVLKPSSNTNLFTSITNYFLIEDESKGKKKRSADQQDLLFNEYESIFNTSRALQLPKIQKFINENPTEEGMVIRLLQSTEQWANRKSRLYESKRIPKRRSKRAITDWFYDPAWPIAFAPNNSAVKEIMGYIGEYLYLDTEGFGFSTEEEMVQQLTTFSLDPDSENSSFFGLEDVLGGIVFTNEFPNGSFPKHITYKIRLKGSPRSGKKELSFAPPPRWNTEIYYPVFQIPGPRNKADNEGGDPGYYGEGFLAMQHAIDKGLNDYMNGKEFDKIVKVEMMRMPYPPFIDDAYLVALQAWLPLIILLSYLYPAINIVRSIVYEKENKLKESMKMMGLDNWLHWLAWYTKSIMILIVSSVLITILLCTRWKGDGNLAVLDNSDPTLVFFFLLVYSSTTIMFCFLLSTLFSKANNGATATGIVWIFSYLPNIYLRPRFLSLSTNVKIGISFYFNNAMSLGCFLTSMFEGTGSGIQWHLISSGVSPDSPFSMAHILIMMFIDMIAYAVLTWYIEAVFPGEFGVPQPWNFIFKREYWSGYKSRDIPAGKEPSESDSNFFEAEPVGIYAGISVRGLTKIFTKRKFAVNNMHLKIYANQISVLLGHNGAGKTTTMSMLTGLFPPTSGTAEVNGYDIVKEMEHVRNSIGICPQHDVLFDDLTVAEHIIFFSELKGLPKNKIGAEVNHILSGIRLTDKINALAKTLSGGMKRKLSVAIALCGGSKVVILDEPTSGMDPGARRVIWDLLQRERNGRTMLLSTHFMEEADLLGDRIAIMANGVIQCCGSSLFLKKTYGAGYHLVIVKDRICDVSKITDVIKSYIGEAELEVNIAAELSYVLPNENVSKFEGLFRELEIRKKELGVSSYGASQTTMEEVFLRVGEANDPEIKMFLQKDSLEKHSTMISIDTPNRPHNKLVTVLNDAVVNTDEKLEEKGQLLTHDLDVEVMSLPSETKRSSVEEFSEAIWQKMVFGFNYAKSASINGLNHIVPSSPRRTPLQRNSGTSLILQQFWAMLVKRALFTFRNLTISITQIIIPILFLILAMIILRNLPGVNDTPPPLNSTLSVYDGTQSFIQNVANLNISQPFLSNYLRQFTGNNKISNIKADQNLTLHLLKKAMKDLPAFNLHDMTGIQVLQVPADPSLFKIISVFNNQPFHVPPVALNLVDQALINIATNDSTIKIDTVNHPLPRTDTEKLTQESRQNIGFNIGFNLAFGMSFLSASFVLFIIKERSSNCKHLQFVSGVNFVIYWLATALWDFLCLVITCLLILLSLYLYKEDGLSEGLQLARIFLVLIVYGWAILPFMYISSYFFSVPSSGFSRMSMIHIFIGMATLITVTILRIPDLHLMHVADMLDWVFMIFPPYAMASAIGDLYSNVRFSNICRKPFIEFLCSLGTFENPCCRATNTCGKYGCVYWTLNPLGWDRLGIGRQLAFLGIEGFLFFIIIAMIEMKLHRSLTYLVKNLYHKLMGRSPVDIEMSTIVSEEEDNDVKAERQRIQNSQLEELFKTDKLVFRDLSKIYGKDFVAVDKLNLGVPLGECFGLLGINGAGKTTTFKMLTGDLLVSGGDAFVNGYSVKKNIKKVQQDIGYCPQFDALLDQLTGRETLRMFARLRGVPESRIDECISSIADQLMVTSHLDKQVGKYSGGNKRKISTGIALIGDPPLVLLDEPTSGMDPVARRHLWDVLNSVRDTGRSIILTSHSMEECEALCTRLAIMTNGSFRCIGSPQQLKSKFSEGYSIILRVKVVEYRDIEDAELSHMPLEMAAVQQFILTTFKKSYLREMQWGRLEYFIPVEAATWAEVFGILERNRAELGIEDYSVTQTTLERVFLNFTRSQRPDEKNE